MSTLTSTVIPSSKRHVKPHKSWVFPCLLKSIRDGTIILATSKRAGVVLVQTADIPPDVISDKRFCSTWGYDDGDLWEESDHLVPLTESITITFAP